MASERYKKFLESETKKNPLRIEPSAQRERLTFAWQSTKEKSVPSGTSDIIDSIYLGKDMQETVIMDRRVAATLQGRLIELEEENNLMRKRVRRMKFLVATLVCVVAAASFLLLRSGFRIGG